MEKHFLMKRNRQYVIASLAVCLIVAQSFGASAQLQVDMKQGKIEPLPVAVVDFFGTGTDAAKLLSLITTRALE